MEYYSNSGNKIMIGHFPGHTKRDFSKELIEFSQRKFHKPDNIGIICPATDDANNVLFRQLELNNYSYYNCVENKTIHWENTRKPFFIVKDLKRCKEEYALILDTNDVAILTDLDDIFDKFNEYKNEFPNLKILFNASIWMHPHVIVDRVPNRGKYGSYCYLNAGCAFGKVEDFISFYEEVCDTFNKTYRPESSEQFFVRKVFDKHQDTVFFDYDCKIFQCWHKQEYRYEDDKCFLI